MRILTKPFLWAVTLPALFSVPNLASAYYDPGVQRWINRDPVADEAGLLGGPAHGSRFPTLYLRQQGKQTLLVKVADCALPVRSHVCLSGVL